MKQLNHLQRHSMETSGAQRMQLYTLICKRGKLGHTQRQYIKWSRLWVEEKDPEKKAIYFRQVLILNKVVGKEKEKC